MYRKICASAQSEGFTICKLPHVLYFDYVAQFVDVRVRLLTRVYCSYIQKS